MIDVIVICTECGEELEVQLINGSAGFAQIIVRVVPCGDCLSEAANDSELKLVEALRDLTEGYEG